MTGPPLGPRVRPGAAPVVLAFALSFACLLVASGAHAFHTRADAPVYLTGHVLPRKTFRVGLGPIAYGIFDFLQVETNVLGYVLPIVTGDFAPNLGVRVGLRRLDPVFLSFGMGATYLRLSSAHEEALGDQLGGALDTELWSMPMIGGVSYHPTDALLISTDVAYFVTNNTAAAATDAGNSTAVLASSSLQGGLTAQYAISRVFAFTLKARMVFWAPTVPFEVTAQVDDANVTLEGNVEMASIDGAYQIVPGVAFSWKAFNLRLGVGYGNFFVPNLGLVSSYQGFMPDLELYFRF